MCKIDVPEGTDISGLFPTVSRALLDCVPIEMNQNAPMPYTVLPHAIDNAYVLNFKISPSSRNQNDHAVARLAPSMMDRIT